MQTDTSERNVRQELFDEGRRILHFWRDRVLLQDGGFHGEIDHTGRVKPDADRGLILAARILWTFSRAVASGFEATAENRAQADKSYAFLVEHFWDEEYLGFYWMLNAKHEPVNDRKHIYAQSFAIYALSEYYAATGKLDALVRAQLTHQLIERYARDIVSGGYLESFTRAWTSDDDLRLSEVDLAEAKSMNTHLHILEAYTRLYQVWPNEELSGRLIHLLDVCKNHILDQETYHYHLFFDQSWTVKSDLISYGHDIEGSWLMLEAAEALGHPDLIDTFAEIAVNMVDVTLAQGLDADGGLMNEGHGTQVVDSDKHWWPQAEALVGCINAYQITGAKRYLSAAQSIWSFIVEKMIDRTLGEWFWKVNRAGVPDAEKPIVEPWKCPYHNTRAMIEGWQRLDCTSREMV